MSVNFRARRIVQLAVFAGFLLARTTLFPAQPEALEDLSAPSPLDPAIKQLLAGKRAAFNALSAKLRFKLIRRLKERIVPQDELDSAHALAAGAALVSVQAEQALRALIVDLYGDGYVVDREIGLVFHALSFMKSKAAVRVLASFLNDPYALAIRAQIAEMQGIKDARQYDAYLNARPKLRAYLHNCVCSSLLDEAEYALGQMNLPGAPMWNQLYGFEQGDDQRWRDWWSAYKGQYKGPGPLPTNWE